MCNFGQGGRWLHGKIEDVTGPVSYRVRMSGGNLRPCHQDQLRPRFGPDLIQNSQERQEEILLPISDVDPQARQNPPQQSEEHTRQAPAEVPPPQDTRRMGRVSRPPDRYDSGLF